VIIRHWYLNVLYDVHIDASACVHSSHYAMLMSAALDYLKVHGLSTVGVAAARIWNTLPQHVTFAPSLLVLWSRLKTHLFTLSYLSPPLPCTVPVYILTPCQVVILDILLAHTYLLT